MSRATSIKPATPRGSIPANVSATQATTNALRRGNKPVSGGAGAGAGVATATASNAVPMQPTNPVQTAHPTDTYIPMYLKNLVPELNSYEQLLEAEKKLDIYLAKKKIDLYQNLSQWNNSAASNGIFKYPDAKAIQYLRVFISNIAENQPWQDPNFNTTSPERDEMITAAAITSINNNSNTNNNPSSLQTNNSNSMNNNNNAAASNPNAPSWTMRIEGRLLNDQNAQDPNRAKFSSFIQDIAVDFIKPAPKEEETNKEIISSEIQQPQQQQNDLVNGTGLSLPLQMNQQQQYQPLVQPPASQPPLPQQQTKTEIKDIVEWHFDPNNLVDFDGLDIKRTGSENLTCVITIQPRGITGEILQYSPQLTSIIGLARGSLHEAIYSIYKYILINDLLVDDDTVELKNNVNAKQQQNTNANVNTNNNNNNNTNGEKTIIELDDLLSTLINDEIKPSTIKLGDLQRLVSLHISPIPPIKIDYTVRVDKASTYGELVFDIEVPNPFTEETSNSSSTSSSNSNTSANVEADPRKEMVTLLSELDKTDQEMRPIFQDFDKQITTLQLQLNDTANKYKFYKQLAEDPVPVLQEYIASSANALKVLSGDEGFNEDSVRRAQFYKDNEAMLYENLSILLANGRM
ncbi:Rsc6p NDAI_0I00490 [Naumovozyma dairenensis CBS 421]|uniref:Transcription regulatory protein SNF12 n=1 Tax=Naumovozyma dairenensis (strain ATCC 10597 / BCRC 20456 / CBS 421 / NBRC 0211 / NRRL Y-12639) TaxID=1071378 RepID=G0WFQ7_NAUDC|nr:hypothetical protein NDAI_0I00490 [Naumovozyma dairenensis CBS 421]CCD26618.1 hypothetical protein NDAI_0I00490 [Naumovozyma dairenensis CBS 421]